MIIKYKNGRIKVLDMQNPVNELQIEYGDEGGLEIKTEYYLYVIPTSVNNKYVITEDTCFAYPDNKVHQLLIKYGLHKRYYQVRWGKKLKFTIESNYHSVLTDGTITKEKWNEEILYINNYTYCLEMHGNKIINAWLTSKGVATSYDKIKLQLENKKGEE